MYRCIIKLRLYIKKLIFKIYEYNFYHKEYIQFIRINNMASKAKQTKAPTVYAFVLYNGFITRGCTFVTVSSTHPESEVDGEIVFDSYKQYYSDDVKGRYVKSVKSIDEIVQELSEKLENVVYTKDSIFLCRSNVTDVVKVLKEVTGAKQCSTMGVYATDEQETEEKATAKKVSPKTAKADEEVEDEESKTKKVAPKKIVSKKTKDVEQEEEQVEEDKPAKKVIAKAPTKPKVVTKPKVESEEEGEQEIEAKPAPKKVVKTAPKTIAKKVTTELDDDLEEDVVVQTKGKSAPKGGTKTQIVISDDEEEAEN